MLNWYMTSSRAFNDELKYSQNVEQSEILKYFWTDTKISTKCEIKEKACEIEIEMQCEYNRRMRRSLNSVW